MGCDNILVGGIPTPLKKYEFRQVGMMKFPNIYGKIIIHSMVPVTTNQIDQID